MNDLNEQKIAEIVRRYLKDQRLGGVTLDVVEQGIRKEESWWYVPIRPSIEPPKLAEYYEALAEIEEELQEKEKLTVLLFPTSVNAPASL